MPNSKQSILSILLFGVCFLSSSAIVSADEKPELPEVGKVRALIEAEKETILFFAHPEATLQSLNYDGHKKLDDGYSVTYTFRWKRIKDTEGQSQFIFYSDQKGKFDFIRVGETSATIFKPFLASGVVISLLKKQVEKDVEMQNNRALMKLFEKDAKGLLETYLRKDVDAFVTLVKAVMKARETKP